MYSQNDEEAFILGYFDGKGTGTFLEIGAFDPIKFSNTRALVEAGWKGVYIEPSDMCMARFRTEYAANPGIQLLSVCVGTENGTTEFFDSGGDAISTMFESETTRWTVGHGSQFARVQKPVVTVACLLEMCKPKQFEFISIDTEGNCLQIMKQFDFNAVGCQLVCVEWGGSDLADYVEIFSKAGFSKVYQNGENLIYGRTQPAFKSQSPASDSLVSILVPVHNSGSYLEATIQSLRAQTYRDIEIVVLDDGSTDGSGEILEKNARIDPRIVVLPRFEQNKGVVATRNTLLFHSRGAFIAWNDSDDVSKPERIERQVTFLRANPRFGAVGTGIIYANEALDPVGTESYPADPKRQAADPHLCCATLLARRNAASEAGRFRPVFSIGGEDGDWLLRMADQHQITNIPDHLYVYRRHDKSLTSNRTNIATVVRLGVVARAAARIRRRGLGDPVNALIPDRLNEQLSAHALMTDSRLSNDEVLTGLTRSQPGEAPAVSIGHFPCPNRVQLTALLASYRAQSLQSFELLFATADWSAPDLANLTGDGSLSVKAVTFDPSRQSPWEAMIDRSEGLYFVYAPSAEPLKAWKIHETVRHLLLNRGAHWIVSRNLDWRNLFAPRPKRIARDVLRQASWPGLIVRRSSATAALAGTATEGGGDIAYVGHDLHDPVLATQLLRTAAARLSAARRIQRQAGFRGLSSAILYRVIGRRTTLSPVGRRVMGTAAPSIAKSDLPEALPKPPASPPPAIDYQFAASQAELKVAVYESWGDFEESLLFMTPNGSAIWDGVLFAPASAVPNPDFALVLNTPSQDEVTLTLPPNRVWFACGEPPISSHRILHQGQGDGTVALTCDPDLANQKSSPRRYIYSPVSTRTWHVKRSLEQLQSDSPFEKPKRLSWITSNTTELEGHRRRMAFLAELKAKVEFDLFGRGFTPIGDKWDGLAPYRYSIAFENTVAPLYFTEKLMDCFVCQTLPFYYGSPEITKHFPPESLITIDPDDPTVFDKIRDISNSDLWLERQTAVAEARHLVLTKFNLYARLSASLRGENASAQDQKPVTLRIHRQVAI